MSRIAEYANSTAEHLKSWFLPFAGKITVSAGFLPAKMTISDSIYVDVMPASFHGETVEQRKIHIRNEDNTVCILVRSKLPEKFTEEDIDAIVDTVERIGDLMLDTSWGEDTRCSSIDVAFNEIVKGLCSSTIVVHIKTRWDCQG